MTKITLRPGDYVRTKGMTEEQYHAVAKAFMEAGARDDGDVCFEKHKDDPSFLGWDERDWELWDCSLLPRGFLRELTIDQIIGTEPDADGWIEWHGGECPVSGDAIVDAKTRCGARLSQVECALLAWDHLGMAGDIIAYRIHQPEQEETPMTIEQLLAKANKHAAKAARHESKAAKHTARQLEYFARAAEMVPEGYELRLKDDGEVDVAEADNDVTWIKPEGPEEKLNWIYTGEDMTDPSNWRAGDVVECVSGYAGVGLSEGGRYSLREECRPYPTGPRASIEADDHGQKNGHDARYFRWISRPQ